MNNTKKLYLTAFTLLFAVVCMPSANAQETTTKGFNPGDGFKQINFGVEIDGWGVPIYVGMDFGVSEMITIGPRMTFQTRSSEYGIDNELSSRSTIFLPSFRGDYHFSGHIEGLPNELDLYGGLTAGLVIWSSSSESYAYQNGEAYITESNSSSSDLELWMQVGARYYFSEKWGVQLEFVSFGNNGSIGFSYKL